MLLTGPQRGETERRLNEAIEAVRIGEPAARCAVLIAEDRWRGSDQPAINGPQVSVQTMVLPCLCCPSAIDLAGVVRTLVGIRRPDCLFLQLPVLAAAGLLAEFDTRLGWPREFVVCLNAAWSQARREEALSYFQFQLLSAATRVFEPGERALSANLKH